MPSKKILRANDIEWRSKNAKFSRGGEGRPSSTSRTKWFVHSGVAFEPAIHDIEVSLKIGII